jgi:hypothetical protein
MNNSQYPIQMNQQSMQNGGLNMSFNDQSLQQSPMQIQHQFQQQLPIQNQQGGMNGINNPLNFNNNNNNNNIKVVALDTKISDGYFYSGSNNLDPFTNSRK